MELLSKLQAFRQEAYSYLGRAKDAIFELMDAVILTRSKLLALLIYPYAPFFVVNGQVHTNHCRMHDLNEII